MGSPARQLLRSDRLSEAPFPCLGRLNSHLQHRDVHPSRLPCDMAACDERGGLNSCGVAAAIVKEAIAFGSNRRFAMSAWKRVTLGLLLCALVGNVAQADPITWPIGLDNWLIYRAAPSDGGGAPPAAPISYSVPTGIPAANQPAPAQPAPPQSAPVQPPSSPPPNVTANTHLSLALAPSAPAAAPSPAPVTSSPADAFINLGSGSYPQQSTITTGNALPWYDSSHITSFFGGNPTAQQIQSFDNTILQRVQQTFSLAGVNVTLTTNPNVAALHTLSLVSNTASASLSTAIGMTQVGHNGFSFIDQIAPSAQSLDQLEWIVAHNISHELMLAFGVPENYDQTGNYIDSKVANWSMMVSPTSTFSPAAAQAITQALAVQNGGGSGTSFGAQEFNTMPSAIPEPTTWALWGLSVAAIFLTRLWKKVTAILPCLA